MANLIVNIIFGYILETIFFSYTFNKIKSVSYKSTYIIFLISYIISAIIVNFSFNNIYIFYISIAFIFALMYCLFHKQKYNITNALLMLNLLLISSILTTIPILIFGYNITSFILNRIEIILLLIIVKILPVENIYKLIISNWNRTVNNKIKSVTIRNFTMIIIYFLITIVNIFLNEFFLNIYQNIL